MMPILSFRDIKRFLLKTTFNSVIYNFYVILFRNVPYLHSNSFCVQGGLFDHLVF